MVDVDGARHFKARLKSHETLYGFWSSLASNVLAEIVSLHDFDWILFDKEHAINEPTLLLSQLHAIKGSKLHPIVRVEANSVYATKIPLDIGFNSLIFPLIESAEEAAAAVRATRYPPIGSRGVSGTQRAANYGHSPDYFVRANDGMTVICQIESPAGLANAAAISAVEGVDAVMIGPRDLAASLGYGTDIHNLDVQRAIETVCRAIRSQSRAAGIIASNMDAADRYKAMGFSLISVAGDISTFNSALTSLDLQIRARR